MISVQMASALITSGVVGVVLGAIFGWVSSSNYTT